MPVLSDPFNPHLGARSLGAAAGSITIDTSDAERARVTMRKVGQDVAQAVKPIDTALKETQRTIRDFRTELIAIGTASAVMTRIGLSGARSVRNYRVSFQQLVGSEQEAVDLMGELTESANEFGINVEEVWQLARALLPTLEGDTEELDAFVKRAALLASTNPLKSTADAARAIQEYLSGQTISLQRLFNVDPNIIAEAQAQFSGVGDQLDYILGRLGATEEGATEMADSFIAVRNSLKLALAEGFTPLFQTLQPIARDFADLVTDLRQSNPEILKIGAGFAAIATVGAPALLFFGSVIGSLQKIQQLAAVPAVASVLSGAGRAGAIGLSVAGGVGLGIGATRAIGRATDNEAAANANLGDLGTFFKQLYVVIVDTLGKTQVIVLKLNGILEYGALYLQDGLGAVLQVLGQFVSEAGKLFPGQGPLDEAGAAIQAVGRDMRVTSEDLAAAIELMQQRVANAEQQARERTARAAGIDISARNIELGNRAPYRDTTSVTAQITDDEINLWIDFQQQIADINRQARQDRIEATRQYEEQRTELIASYELSLARDAEDFARQRARDEQQLARDIAEVRADALEQEAEAVAEHQERVADLRQEYAGRIEDLEADHQKKLLDIQRDYETRIREAAGGLDANAVRQLQQQRDDALRDERGNYQDRLSQEQENLQERIEQEQEAHEERLQTAREADEERIRSLTDSLRERQRLEDEDQAIRLRRMREDHIRQLNELAEANQQRLHQINQQARREKQLLETQFQEEYLALGDYLNTREDAEARYRQRALRALADYWNAHIAILEGTGVTNLGGADTVVFPDGRTRGRFQTGGPVPSTGPYTLERDEYVLNPRTASTIRTILGGQLTQPALVGALAGGGKQASLTLAEGAIQINEARRPGVTGQEVYNALVSILETELGN